MKSILFSTLSAWLARLLAIAINIVGLPLALSALGQERFGLLLIVLSVGSWIGFANIGMGRVVSNIIARYKHLPSGFVANSISTATAIAAIINIALFIISSVLFLTSASIFPLNTAIENNYAQFTVSIVSLFFALTLWFFLSVFEGVDAGHHQVHRLHLFQLPSYALSLILIVFAFPRHPSIVFATYLLSLSFLPGSLLHAVDVVRRNRDLFVAGFKWRRGTMRLLLLSSIDFTIISLGLGILFQLATGLFGFIAGPSAVVELGVFMRLMQSYGTLVIAFTYPLSNIVASKIAARDYVSALRTARFSGLLLFAGCSAGAVIFYMYANQLLSIWLHSDVKFRGLFLVSASALIVVSAMHFYFAALLIGGGDTKSVARIHLLEAAAFIPFAYALFTQWQEGGVLLALDITLFAGILSMLNGARRHVVLGHLSGIRFWGSK